MAIRLHEIIQLQSFPFRFPLAIHINHILHDFQRISRLAHTALYVVLPPIHRACDDFAKYIPALPYQRFAVVVLERVIIRILHVGANRIARREIENHNIAFLRTRPARETLIIPMRFIQVTLSSAKPSRHRVLHQRHRQRRLRNTCPVSHLAHVEKIAYA